MKRVVTVVAVTATALGTVLTVAPAASAQSTLRDPQAVRGSITSWPAQGTGGLILRDRHGNDLGSGIGEGQDFEFTACGDEGSGLVKVRQLTRGTGGGWGSLYDGYVKIEWTSAPVLFSFCD